VVQLLRELGAFCVRGNNDDEALAAHAAWRRGEAVADKFDFVGDLQDEDTAFLARLPFSISLPEYSVVVVHAGRHPCAPKRKQ
jgi:hypothetical protein